MEKLYRMPGVLSNNVHQEPVEEKNHSKSIGILSHHIPFDIANSYPKWNKSLKCYNLEN